MIKKSKQMKKFYSKSHQEGSVMVESAFGMFVLVIMLLSMSWFFEVTNFSVQEEITAGVTLREQMIAENNNCWSLVEYNEVKTIDNNIFNIAAFIGQKSQKFDIKYNKSAWSGACPEQERSRFHNKDTLRQFRGPDMQVRGPW